MAVSVDSGSGRYSIHLEEGAIDQIPAVLSSLDRDVSSVAVITDKHVEEAQGDRLRTVLEKCSIPFSTFVIPPGERRKSVDWVEELCSRLLTARMDRKSVVIAFGGGVVGDLAGTVAALYMRGLRYIQVPTSLLAQVDASIGGKVAVNLPDAKNMLGRFYHPEACITDPEMLATLPEEEFRSGMAEVIKYGVIGDANFLAFLEENHGRIMDRDPEALLYILDRSIRCKVRVVEEDEKGRGLRQILNFGHTIGHGIEAASGYGGLRHGEAVAVGMSGAVRISKKENLLEEKGFRDRLNGTLQSYGLPVQARNVDPASVLQHIKKDKKGERATPEWVLLRKPGDSVYGRKIEEKVYRDAVEALCGGGNFGGSGNS